MEEPRSAKANHRLAYAVLICLLFVGFGVGLVSLNKNGATCTETYRRDSQISTGHSSIQVQIAQTDSQRQKGLGGRQCLQANQGLLFKFGNPGYYPFWMKDMKFPIDLVWINSAHQVVDVDTNVGPSTYPKTFVSQTPAQDVLELSAGQAERYGIKPGTHLNY